MNKGDIFSKIKTIIYTVLETEIAITEESELLGDFILDSLEFMNFITKVEEEFDIQISDDDIEEFQLGIVQNMMDYLEKKI